MPTSSADQLCKATPSNAITETELLCLANNQQLLRLGDDGRRLDGAMAPWVGSVAGGAAKTMYAGLVKVVMKKGMGARAQLSGQSMCVHT